MNKKNNQKKQCDGVEVSGSTWLYSEKVKDHFFNPRNVLKPGEEDSFNADGVGYVGSPACGDVMKVWIKVDSEKDVIADARWQTFGCGSAIASTSMMTEMVKGMKLDKAIKLTPQDIIDALGGLPNRKIHCSVLGDKALRQAINDYFRKSGQLERVVTGIYRILDKKLKITDRDIEEAVLEGADTLEKVQAKTKVGTGDSSCLPEVKKLVSFFVEKYYG